MTKEELKQSIRQQFKQYDELESSLRLDREGINASLLHRADKASYDNLRDIDNALERIAKSRQMIRENNLGVIQELDREQQSFQSDASQVETPSHSMWDKLKSYGMAGVSGAADVLALPSRSRRWAYGDKAKDSVLDIPAKVAESIGKAEEETAQKAGTEGFGLRALIKGAPAGLLVPGGSAATTASRFAGGAASSAGLSGIDEVERISKEKENYDVSEGVGRVVTSGLAGGVLNAGLGKILDKFSKKAPVESKSENAGEAAREVAQGTRLLTDERVQPGQVKGGVVYGGEPPKALPVPTEPKGSAYAEMVESIRTQPKGTPLTPAQESFLMREFKRVKGETPPSGSGARDVVTTPEQVRQSHAAETLSMEPSSPPYPGSMYGMPGVKPPESKVVEVLEKAKGKVRGKKANSIVAKEAPIVDAEAVEVTPFEIPKEAPKKVVAPVSAKVSTEVDDAVAKAAEELNLGKVVKGELDPGVAAKEIKAKRPKNEPTMKLEQPVVGKSEVAPEFEYVGFQKGFAKKPGFHLYTLKNDYPGLTKGSTYADKSLIEKGFKLPESPKTENLSKAGKTLETFLGEKGFKVQEKPDPLHGTTYRVFDKKGKPIAAGTREDILNAVGQRPEAKGVKLHSFPPGPADVKELFNKEVKSVGSALGKLDDAADFVSRPLKPERVVGREHPAMSEAQSQIKERYTAQGARFRDFLYKQDEKGEFHPTKYFIYDNLDKPLREKVNRVLVYGDQIGRTFDDASLVKAGLSSEEMAAYRGVREALDSAFEQRLEIADRLKKLKDPTAIAESELLGLSKLDGYIPHTWPGKFEVFVGGAKQSRLEKGDLIPRSYFETELEAIKFAHELKVADPKASVEIKSFRDPDFLSIGPIEKSIFTSQIKQNLELMERLGKITSYDPKLIDEAAKFGQTLKAFTRHLLHRKGEEGYRTENLEEVIQAYLYKNSKYIENKKMQVAVANILKEATDLRPDQLNWIQNLAERVAGKPSFSDEIIHSVLEKSPIGKMISVPGYHQTVRTAQELGRHIFLGAANVGYATVNAFSLGQHVWPALAREGVDAFDAEKYMIKGIQEYFKNPKLRQELAHKGIIDIQRMSELMPDIKHSKTENAVLRASMWLGTTTEEFTRGVAAIARYRMALDQGWPKEEALRAARVFVEDALGDYSVAGRPLAFTGSVGSTIGMFKTFTAVFLANMFRAGSGLTKGEIGAFTRYAMATVGLAGLYGMPGIDEADSLMTQYGGVSPKKWMRENLPEWSTRGLLSVGLEELGFPTINISYKAGLPDLVPNDIAAALGPLVGTAYRVAKNTIEDPSIHTAVKETAKAILPTSVKNVLKATTNQLNYRERPGPELSTGEKIAKGLGFPPAKEVEEMDRYFEMEGKKQYRNKKLRDLADKIVDGQASEEDYDEFAKLGGSNKILKNAQLGKMLPPLERQGRYLPKILRQE